MAISIKVQPKLTTDNKIDLLSKGVNLDAIQLDKEQKIKERIDNGSITADNFSQLSNDEQETVKLVLFKNYSPTMVDVPKSLSAAEFLFVATLKLLAKSIDRTKLSSEESTFFDSLLAIINLNDMPIDDTTDWRFQYLQQQFTDVQNNRATYLQQKQNVTGQV